MRLKSCAVYSSDGMSAKGCAVYAADTLDGLKETVEALRKVDVSTDAVWNVCSPESLTAGVGSL